MQGFNREVILGVGGGIAAYKSCDLLRRLQDHGFAVTVVPTPSSLNFVGKATWEALSGRAVTADVFENVEEVRHVSLAKKADFIIIAPATADLIARIAAGRADDLLTNVVLAADVPILVVPAMHPQMWNDPATLANVETLRTRGFIVLDPEIGALTSGDVGQGRFPETATILQALSEISDRTFDLLGKKILITAGGTREPIDSVRFIGNQSSGKQGFAVARSALRRGATVTLIAANTNLSDIDGVTTVHVQSAQEMLDVLTKEFEQCDVLVMAAAVADARPESVVVGKIRKSDYGSINLVENPDLLKTILANKSHQVVIAFAAEGSHDVAAAEAKLSSKGADILYLNDISHGDIFNSETTYGEIFIKDCASVKVAKTTKDTLANQLLDQALLKLG
ncbi:MAG: bifunctional phosphopantothenoylcysteine decarboxylase/phosphopantothenate--cysteine ligase CoaBC [Actinobacteria bacterium]|jgi:phosphopantothenoylcysteine decarboxylase/phosphopantothenate--cysteine ligase|nr:bifunctional phosphopantothenoylcysteine decarboxylase/phosphopantothenate--cysteine ligase CoaBC [Actinomycetota bacterium]